MAPPPQLASSSGEEDMSASYSPSQDREAADKDTEEAVVQQPLSAVARSSPAPPEPKSKRARRTWSPHDEAQILEALAEHCREHGHPPLRSNNALLDSLAQRLEDQSWRHNEIKDKMSNLKRRYESNSVPTSDHEQLVYNLSNVVWGDKPVAAATAGAENGGEEQRGFEEMCELYPHLAQEVKVLTVALPAVKRSFPRLDGSIARAMEAKLEKVAWAKVKMQVKINKDLVNLLMELRRTT